MIKRHKPEILHVTTPGPLASSRLLRARGREDQGDGAVGRGGGGRRVVEGLHRHHFVHLRQDLQHPAGAHVPHAPAGLRRKVPRLRALHRPHHVVRGQVRARGRGSHVSHQPPAQGRVRRPRVRPRLRLCSYAAAMPCPALTAPTVLPGSITWTCGARASTPVPRPTLYAQGIGGGGAWHELQPEVEGPGHARHALRRQPWSYRTLLPPSYAPAPTHAPYPATRRPATDLRRAPRQGEAHRYAPNPSSLPGRGSTEIGGPDDLRAVMDANPSVRLAIVGTGPYAEDLKKLFKGTKTVFTEGSLFTVQRAELTVERAGSVQG
eukprot:1350581-Rhodomonas_salina.1